jgi:hypothetical protein
MLAAYLFDERQGEQVEAWADAVDNLGESQVVWVDLVEPSADEARADRQDGAGARLQGRASRRLPHPSYVRALRSAQRLIYLENQFLWAPEIAEILCDKLVNPPVDDFRT